MPQLSNEIKNTIIELYSNGHKPSSIIKHLGQNVAISTIYKLIAKQKTTGSVSNKKRQRKSKLPKDVLDFIQEFTNQHR